MLSGGETEGGPNFAPNALDFDGGPNAELDDDPNADPEDAPNADPPPKADPDPPKFFPNAPLVEAAIPENAGATGCEVDGPPNALVEDPKTEPFVCGAVEGVREVDWPEGAEGDEEEGPNTLVLGSVPKLLVSHCVALGCIV